MLQGLVLNTLLLSNRSKGQQHALGSAAAAAGGRTGSRAGGEVCGVGVGVGGDARALQQQLEADQLQGCSLQRPL